jgi:hypothetical protein
MKRNQKSFSVEIKKSRVQGQRSLLLPRHLFETAPAAASTIFWKEEPQPMANPSATPRILLSIVAPLWSNSEPMEAVRRKYSSGEADREQMEFALDANATEDVNEAPVRAKAVPQTEVAPAVTEDAAPVHDVQSARGESTWASSRKPRKKASGGVEPVMAFNLTPGSESVREAEMHGSQVVAPRADQRRLTRRQAAAVHLPRNERWKRRFHPASW